jgi:hypothetical protein
MEVGLVGSRFTPEQLQARLASLACEREQMRRSGAATDLLEQNRLEIVHCQHEFSCALVQRHLPQTVMRAA